MLPVDWGGCAHRLAFPRVWALLWVTQGPAQPGSNLRVDGSSSLHCWWGWKLVQPLWRAVWRVLNKQRKIKLPYDPALLLLGIYPEKTMIQTDTCTPSVQIWRQPKCPLTEEWAKKMWTYMRWNITQPLKRTKWCRLLQHCWVYRVSYHVE